MSCCSESEVRVPVAIWTAPSVEPVVENDQQLPHWPWFLTGVTAPLARQSTAASSTPERTCSREYRAQHQIAGTNQHMVTMATNAST